MHQVFIQQIRRTVALFKCLLIKYKAQAVRPKKLHVGFVQVIGDDFDLPLASFFLDRPAYAFLPVGGYIDPSDVRVFTQRMLRHLISIIIAVKTRLKGQNPQPAEVFLPQGVKEAIQPVVVGRVIQMACQRQHLAAVR